MINKSGKVTAFIFLTTINGLAQTVVADSTKATCMMFRHGEEKPNASGDCTISQRQGYIDIKLHNGHTFSLSPTGSADHYKDEDGDRVVQTREKGDTHRYKWDDKYLVVDFNSDTSHQAGDPVRGLLDLVGKKTSKAEEQMESRGYNPRNSSHSGKSTYSNWKEHASGRCVSMRSENGHVKSIVFSSEYDCRQ